MVRSNHRGLPGYLEEGYEEDPILCQRTWTIERNEFGGREDRRTLVLKGRAGPSIFGLVNGACSYVEAGKLERRP